MSVKGRLNRVERKIGDLSGSDTNLTTYEWLTEWDQRICQMLSRFGCRSTEEHDSIPILVAACLASGYTMDLDLDGIGVEPGSVKFMRLRETADNILTELIGECAHAVPKPARIALVVMMRLPLNTGKSS